MRYDLKSVLRAVVAVLTSWWFLGILGWSLVVWFYPVDSVLPTYAN